MASFRFLSHVRPLRTACESCRSVATWTPLAATFNRKPQRKISFAFNRERKGLFGYPELAHHQGFHLLREKAEADAERLVKEATSKKRTRNVVEICDELSDVLCRVADLAECVRVLHGDTSFSDSAEDANSEINGLVEELNTNRPLYDSLKNAVEKGDVKPMDEVDLHVAKLFLLDFEQCGIHLEEDKTSDNLTGATSVMREFFREIPCDSDENQRRKVVALNARILGAGTSFMKRCQEPRYVRASLVPETIQPYFHREGENIIITNLMSDCTNELVRETAYRAYLAPDSYQNEPLQELLYGRYQLARLVGFDSFSSRANRGSVFENAGTISQFLQTLSEKIRPTAEDDIKIMVETKQLEEPGASVVRAWDVAHLVSSARHARTEIDTTELSPYFPLGACVEGLNQLFDSLFGVHFVIEEAAATEDLWSSDVYKMSVRTREDETIGFVYCDFYERPNKPHQDCHFTIRCGRQLPDGSYQFWQIDNLFHEMGHAMHSMLGRTKYQHVTGTRCSTDFAEIPSTLMEQFAADSRVLSRISSHYQTGASLSGSSLEKLSQSRRVCSATEHQLQTFYAILDQAYHGPNAPVDTTEMYAKLHDQHVSTKYVPNTAWQLRFGHLFGYGARYYSYLLARSVASDIWQKLFKNDPYSREAGRRLRDKLLCHGGGRPPMELISDLLEHKPGIDELVEALVTMTRN